METSAGQRWRKKGAEAASKLGCRRSQVVLPCTPSGLSLHSKAQVAAAVAAAVVAGAVAVVVAVVGAVAAAVVDVVVAAAGALVAIVVIVVAAVAVERAAGKPVLHTPRQEERPYAWSHSLMGPSPKPLQPTTVRTGAVVSGRQGRAL